jgi:phosphoglycolate phosphatase
MGLPQAAHQAIKATIGLSLPATLVRLTGLTDPMLAERFTAHFVECADLRMVDLTTIFPDASRAVHELRNAGIKTGIVSTKYRYRIEAILTRDGLTDGFDVIVGGEDVVHHKPDPEGIHLALTQIGLSGADAMYVGDHPVDAMAASAAGIPFVAVLTGNALRDDFDQWSGTRFIEGLPDLVPLLTENWGRQSQNPKRSS